MVRETSSLVSWSRASPARRFVGRCPTLTTEISDGGSVGVSIGLTGVDLTWSTPTNETSHSLGSGPSAEWTDELGQSGSDHWFKPGSTLVSDHTTCNSDGELLVELNAETDWGWNVYSASHTWNLYTYGCW